LPEEELKKVLACFTPTGFDADATDMLTHYSRSLKLLQLLKAASVVEIFLIHSYGFSGAKGEAFRTGSAV